MGTKHNQGADFSQEGRRDRRKEQKIARLADDKQVKRLLSYYELSLTEAIPTPLFGADQRFQLAIYDEKHERISQLVLPTLEHLSQDLGFVENAGYEAIKQLPIPDFWLKQLFERASEAGKQELNRYLHDLRPLLMEKHIFLYCTVPVMSVQTEIHTGNFSTGKGKRPLSALPMSVQAAEMLGCSSQRTKELAPQVAWLIPMLVVYRKVKAIDQLLVYFDGWLDLLTPQQNEQMYTKFVKNAPYLVDEEVTRLLLHNWNKHRKR